jgi:hypothetical protein
MFGRGSQNLPGWYLPGAPLTAIICSSKVVSPEICARKSTCQRRCTHKIEANKLPCSVSLILHEPCCFKVVTEWRSCAVGCPRRLLVFRLIGSA